MTSLLESLSLFPRVLEHVSAFKAASASDKKQAAEALNQLVQNEERRLREDLKNNFTATLAHNCEVQVLTAKANSLQDRTKQPLNITRVRKWNGDARLLIEELEKMRKVCENDYTEHYVIDARFQAFALVKRHVVILVHKSGLSQIAD